MDTLDINKLPEDSKIEYNVNYGGDELRVSTAVPIHYYKIFNNEKQKLTPEDSTSQEG